MTTDDDDIAERTKVRLRRRFTRRGRKETKHLRPKIAFGERARKRQRYCFSSCVSCFPVARLGATSFQFSFLVAVVSFSFVCCSQGVRGHQFARANNSSRRLVECTLHSTARFFISWHEFKLKWEYLSSATTNHIRGS